MAEQTERTRCEVYSRVVGFLSPVSQWNRGEKGRMAGQDHVGRERRCREKPTGKKSLTVGVKKRGAG